MLKRSLLSALVVLGTITAPSATLAQSPKPTTVYNIKGNLPDLMFELQGLNKTVKATDLQGKTVLVFFGYASCPDICPTTMAELSELKKSLGEHQDKVQIVFISVDPHRDTPEILQAYVDAFDHQGIGLTGTTRQIAEIAKRYRVAYQIEKPKPGAAENNYEVMHAQGIYIFDEKGKARFLASNAENTALLKEKLLELW